MRAPFEIGTMIHGRVFTILAESAESTAINGGELDRVVRYRGRIDVLNTSNPTGRGHYGGARIRAKSAASATGTDAPRRHGQAASRAGSDPNGTLTGMIKRLRRALGPRTRPAVGWQISVPGISRAVGDRRPSTTFLAR